MRIQPLSAYDIELAAQSSKVLSDILKKNKKCEINFSVQIGNQITFIPLPSTAFNLVKELLITMGKGEAIEIKPAPMKEDFTIEEAARFLNTSEEYIISLLDQHKIKFYGTDKNKKIKFEDLIEYKKERTEKREKSLEELSQQAQDMNWD